MVKKEQIKDYPPKSYNNKPKEDKTRESGKVSKKVLVDKLR